MYRWYAEAAICLVYLQDYVYSREEEIDISGWRWLTRGWCLQEMIAPNTVQFYDHHWKKFATKAQLSSMLSSFTGIDQGLLDGLTHISDYPIACRMSWASHRTTTRLEDQAYCLLGLLNVSMPLLYGEGNRAFERLQQEVLRVEDDPSVLVWGTGDLSMEPLLAPTVLHFAQSGGIRFSGYPGQESQVMLTGTSRGIHVQGAKLRLLVEGHYCYMLPFPSLMAAGRDQRGLWGSGDGFYQCLKLRKIGVGTYARLAWSSYHTSGIVDPAGPEEDFYIVDPRLFARGPVIEAKLGVSMTSGSFYGDGLGLVAEPRAAWDSLQSRFFLNPVEDFVGYLRVHPIVARSYGPSSESFVVAIKTKSQRSADSEDDMAVHLSPSRVWDLYSAFHHNLSSCIELVAAHEESIKIATPSGPMNHSIGSLDLTMNLIDQPRGASGERQKRIEIDWSDSSTTSE